MIIPELLGDVPTTLPGSGEMLPPSADESQPFKHLIVGESSQPAPLVVNGLNPDEAAEESETLRERLLDSDLELAEADRLAKQIACNVAVYGDISTRLEELIQGPHQSDVHSNAARLEYNALIKLQGDRRATRYSTDPVTGAATALARISGNQAMGRPVDLQEMTAQITEQMETLAKAGTPLKERMALLAIVNEQVGQHMLTMMPDAKTAEGAAEIGKNAVSVFESNARILEKINRVDQPQPGHVFVKSGTANIAHNQQILGADKPAVGPKIQDSR